MINSKVKYKLKAHITYPGDYMCDPSEEDFKAYYDYIREYEKDRVGTLLTIVKGLFSIKAIVRGDDNKIHELNINDVEFID